jgi:hypothetical protein
MLRWREDGCYQAQRAKGVEMAHGCLPVEVPESVCVIVGNAECVLRVEHLEGF